MSIRCICGNLMHDEDPKTCTDYITLKVEEYYNFLQKDIKSIEEFVDNLPMSDSLWQCIQCGRLCFFRKGKLEKYNEKEYISMDVIIDCYCLRGQFKRE